MDTMLKEILDSLYSSNQRITLRQVYEVKRLLEINNKLKWWFKNENSVNICNIGNCIHLFSLYSIGEYEGTRYIDLLT